MVREEIQEPSSWLATEDWFDAENAEEFKAFSKEEEEEPLESPPISTDTDEAELQITARTLRRLAEDRSLRKDTRWESLIEEITRYARSLAGAQFGDELSQNYQQKIERRRNKKQLDQRLLASAEIRQLRQFRIQNNGGSLPICLPREGEMMLPSTEDSGRLLIGEGENDQEWREQERKAWEERGIDMKLPPQSEAIGGKLLKESPSDSSTVDANINPKAEANNHDNLTASETAKKVEADDLPDDRLLMHAKCCHICKARYRRVHEFYDQLCPECAEFNYAKRHQFVDMSGKIALVTGARVKIGYCVSLKLLRCGARVLATTRFPKNAAERYQQEHDFHEWQHRLHIYGLDFRDIPMVHHFCHHVKRTYPKLDIIINNAAQTVRKPPVFYAHLLKGELMPVSERTQQLDMIVDYASYEPHDIKTLRGSKSSGNSLLFEALNTADVTVGENRDGDQDEASATISASALLSQLQLTEEDRQFQQALSTTTTDNNKNEDNQQQALFPPGLYDIDQQQVDLRTTNSWTLRLGEISTVEMIECHAINSFAPFVINSELKEMLLRGTQTEREQDGKYIVNVSAMEGQFYRHKTHFHPHTNMAKASMNMLTRTSAQDYSTDHIYMNSVDTGWITDENPHTVNKMYTEPPLDEWDAAMRILDPVVMGLLSRDHRHFGVFYKNYQPTRW